MVEFDYSLQDLRRLPPGTFLSDHGPGVGDSIVFASTREGKWVDLVRTPGVVILDSNAPNDYHRGTILVERPIGDATPWDKISNPIFRLAAGGSLALYLEDELIEIHGILPPNSVRALLSQNYSDPRIVDIYMAAIEGRELQ